MELLHLPTEYTLRFKIEKNGEALYDVGVVVDPIVLNTAREDVLDHVFRTIGRRVVADWKDKRF